MDCPPVLVLRRGVLVVHHWMLRVGGRLHQMLPVHLRGVVALLLVGGRGAALAAVAVCLGLGLLGLSGRWSTLRGRVVLLLHCFELHKVEVDFELGRDG